VGPGRRRAPAWAWHHGSAGPLAAADQATRDRRHTASRPAAPLAQTYPHHWARPACAPPRAVTSRTNRAPVVVQRSARATRGARRAPGARLTGPAPRPARYRNLCVPHGRGHRHGGRPARRIGAGGHPRAGAGRLRRGEQGGTGGRGATGACGGPQGGPRRRPRRRARRVAPGASRPARRAALPPRPMPRRAGRPNNAARPPPPRPCPGRRASACRAAPSRASGMGGSWCRCAGRAAGAHAGVQTLCLRRPRHAGRGPTRPTHPPPPARRRSRPSCARWRPRRSSGR
jgi:hypothetical protein